MRQTTGKIADFALKVVQAYNDNVNTDRIETIVLQNRRLAEDFVNEICNRCNDQNHLDPEEKVTPNEILVSFFVALSYYHVFNDNTLYFKHKTHPTIVIATPLFHKANPSI